MLDFVISNPLEVVGTVLLLTGSFGIAVLAILDRKHVKWVSVHGSAELKEIVGTHHS